MEPKECGESSWTVPTATGSSFSSRMRPETTTAPRPKTGRSQLSYSTLEAAFRMLFFIFLTRSGSRAGRGRSASTGKSPIRVLIAATESDARSLGSAFGEETRSVIFNYLCTLRNSCERCLRRLPHLSDYKNKYEYFSTD